MHTTTPGPIEPLYSRGFDERVALAGVCGRENGRPARDDLAELPVPEPRTQGGVLGSLRGRVGRFCHSALRVPVRTVECVVGGSHRCGAAVVNKVVEVEPRLPPKLLLSSNINFANNLKLILYN